MQPAGRFTIPNTFEQTKHTFRLTLRSRANTLPKAPTHPPQIPAKTRLVAKLLTSSPFQYPKPFVPPSTNHPASLGCPSIFCPTMTACRGPFADPDPTASTWQSLSVSASASLPQVPPRWGTGDESEAWPRTMACSAPVGSPATLSRTGTVTSLLAV